MKPAAIGKAYDEIAHLWNEDTLDRTNGIAAHQRAIAFVEARGKAIDVGCGCSGRFIDQLLEEGFQISGVDISTEMIRLAQLRHPQIVFHHQDICSWDLPETYDFITAWDSIWHVPLAELRKLISKLVAALNSGGVLVFSCGGTDEEGELRDDYMGPEVYYSSLGVNGFLQLFLELGCTCRHMEYDQHPQLHCYFIVQKT